MTKKEALATAKKYNLEAEVKFEIENRHCTPEEALAEWDIL